MQTETILKIIKPGLSAIQDLGRQGWQHAGVPVSGAMDRFSFRLANWIVGNPENCPCLEITLIGPVLRFERRAVMAITGADLSPAVNEQAIPVNQVIVVEPGDTLTFGRCRSGCRAYLAVQGEWLVMRWLGSASPVPYSGSLPGLPPSLGAGQEIAIVSQMSMKPRSATMIRREIPNEIGILPGPEWHLFSKESIEHLLTGSFTISNDSNRMGYRLSEKLMGNLPTESMLSSGVVPGTIQVTPSGQMIILMADAQCTGGYPRIANVIDNFLDFLAQKKPGDQVRFNHSG